MFSSRHAPLAITALALAALALSAWAFTVDDAFITARYAQRLADGLGYTFSGARATDGVTGPLWLVPQVVAVRLGLPAVVAAKAVSAVASLIAASWLVARTRREALGRTAAWWVAGACATSLPWVAWTVAGLETGLAAWVATWATIAVLERRAGQAGAAVALMAWLRPELAPFCGVLLCGMGLRRAWKAVAIASVGWGSVLAFRLVCFGHALPMTSAAKPPLLDNGARYLAATLATPRGALGALLFAAACWSGRRDARTRVLGAGLLAHGASVLLVGGDWMPARRLFVPVLPVLAYTLARGLRRGMLRRTWLTASALSLWLLAGAFELISELPALRSAGAARAATHELARVACASTPLALIDVGLLGVLCPRNAIIDLGGLTEPAVAYARGGHLDKRIDEAWLRMQRPAALILHSRERPRVDDQRRLRWFAGYPVERRVLGFAFVREYRVRAVIAYAPAYYYVVLEPPSTTDAPR